MTGDYQDNRAEATVSKPHAEGDPVETDAARVGGWDADPLAARPESIAAKAGRPQRMVPMTAEEWIARHLATAPRISDERWSRIDAVFAVMEDQQRSEAAKPPRLAPE